MDIKVLKNKNLLLVIMGQFVSGLGTYMQSFALSLYVLEKTGSATLFASVLVVSIIPRIILTPFAGVLVDRFSRKKMIVIMDVASGLSVLAIAFMLFTIGELSLIFIYILVILLTVINVFFDPAMAAIIPDIVQKDKLAEANSIMELFYSVVGIGAPLLAGVLFGTYGILTLMIINAISFLLSAASEAFINIEKESIQAEDDKEKFFTSFKAGLSFIKKLPEFIMMMMIAIVANFAINSIFSVALPVVLRQDFGVSEKMYGLFISLMTLGMIIGPIFASKIIKKYHYSKLVFAVLTFDGIICGLLAILSINGLFSSIWINYVAMLLLINLIMVTIIWVNLGIRTARQILVPGHMMGRVTSVISTFAIMAIPLGQAVMGALLDTGNSAIIIGVYALFLTLSGIMAKIGFGKLARDGKMDLSIGLENKTAEVIEDA